MLKTLWMLFTLMGLMVFLTLEVHAGVGDVEAIAKGKSTKTVKKVQKTEEIENLSKHLDYPNDDKELIIRKTRKIPARNVALLYSIQFKSNSGARYSIQDDYHERRLVCEMAGFGEPDRIVPPNTSPGEASSILRIGRDGKKLVRAGKTGKVTMLDMVPCQLVTDASPYGGSFY